MAFPTTVDTITDGTTFGHASQVLGPQRITVGPTMYNVLSDQTGPADPSGATDSSTAIANAEAAAAATGGEVYFPQGTYLAAGLNLDSNVHWRGAGEGATTLKLKNTANTWLVQSTGFAALTGTNGTGGVTNCSISGMTLDGNKANNASGLQAIRVYGYGFRLSNLRIKNAKTVGLYSEWSTSLPSPGADSMMGFLDNIKVHDCDSHGVQWKGPHDSQWTKGEIFNNAGRGIDVGAGGDGLAMTSVHSWGLTQTYACFMGATGVGATGCVFEGAITAQLAIDGNDCFVVGSFIYGFGAIAVPIGIEFGPGGARQDVMVIGVKINNCTSGALKFTNDGGAVVMADVFQGSGTVIAGTISGLTRLDLRTNGVAGGRSRFPVDVEIGQGKALKLYNAAESSFASVAFDGSRITTTWPLSTAAGQALTAGGPLVRSRQTPTEAVLVSGVNAATADIVAVTLTAARLVGAPLNPTVGQRLTFTFIQGGAGAFAVTWNAVFKKVWSDTGNATGARSSISFVYDGTNWNQDGAQAPYV